MPEPDHLIHHPVAAEVKQGDHLVFEGEDGGPQRGEVLRVVYGGDPPGGYVSIEVEVADDRGVWDLEASYRPDQGWSDLSVYQRWYGEATTERIDNGDVSRLDVVDLGVDPESLAPSQTVEDWQGNQWVVVEAPSERSWGRDALAFNRDSGSTVCERLSPDDIRADRGDVPGGSEG